MSNWEIDWEDGGGGEKVATSLERATKNSTSAGKNKGRKPAAPSPTTSPVMPSLELVPDPYQPTGEGELTTQDQANLQNCLAGLALLDAAYWIAGKSLDTMALARLYRRIPRKDDPSKTYTTIEEFAEIHCEMSRSKLTRLRNSWEIAGSLASKGLPTIPGQIRHLAPMRTKYGVDTSVTYFELLHEMYGSALTGAIIQKAVALLPDDFELGAAPEKALTAILAGLNADTDSHPPNGNGLPTHLRRDVDRRAIKLADELNSSRLPRNAVIQTLLEAFTDETDETVFKAVLKRMRNAGSTPHQ